MYSLIRSQKPSDLVTREVPTFGAAFVIAELFYKFHSFSLECLAFLGTWFVLSFAVHLVLRPPASERAKARV